jgi:hypothetical protein
MSARRFQNPVKMAKFPAFERAEARAWPRFAWAWLPLAEHLDRGGRFVIGTLVETFARG